MQTAPQGQTTSLLTLTLTQTLTLTLTPRPDYETPELSDATTWLEMEGIARSNYKGTSDYVTALSLRLAGALEENQLLRRNAGIQARRLEDRQSTNSIQEALPKFIQGYGTGDEIPKYLRWKGPMRLRPIGKREIEVRVRVRVREEGDRG